MFKVMCQGEEESEAEPQEQTPKKHVRHTTEKIFQTTTQAFLIAVSIGIIREKKIKIEEEKHQLIRGEFLRKDKNYKYFKQLIKSKFGVKTEHEIVDFLVQFSEFGVRELYNEYHKTGDIDFVRLAKLSGIRENQ